MFLLALEWGGNTYSWNSTTVIGLFVGSFATVCVFIAWEWHRGDTAMIPLAMLSQRVVYCACLTAGFHMGALQVITYYLPEWFQIVQGVSPTISGVFMLPSIGFQVMFSLITGFLGMLVSTHIFLPGYYGQRLWLTTVSPTNRLLPFAISGSILTAIGGGLLGTLYPSISDGNWIGYQILVGSGRGMVVQQVRTLYLLSPSPSPLLTIFVFTYIPKPAHPIPSANYPTPRSQ